MATEAETANIHDLALETFRHLKEMPKSPERTQHIFRMICAVERSAAGLLDAEGEQQAWKDIEAAAEYCQSG